jgi:hypothetical protein
MEPLDPRVLGLLAIAGAIATFATSSGEVFPNWIAWVSLGIAATFFVAAAVAFYISSYPNRVARRVPRSWIAGPIALHRRRLIKGDKVPVTRGDFKIVWQDWSDDVTSLLREQGFPRERAYAEDADEGSLLREYHRSLRNQALRLSDEASDQKIVDRLYRERFYNPTSADDVWKLVRNVADTFVEPESAPRRVEASQETS